MELNERVAKLEVGQKEARLDVAEIKTQVMNHIPTQIEEVRKAVYALRTEHVAQTAVRESWNKNIQKVAVVLGVVWTLIKLLELLK